MTTSRLRPTIALAVLLAAGPAAASPAAAGPAAPLPDRAELLRREAQYAPVDLTVDLGRLPATERKALARLVEAARAIDGVYLQQTWGGNPALLLALVGDGSPLGQARLAFFLRNKGPWDHLADGAPFLPGVPPLPPQGGFYPADATRQEVQAWLDGLPEAERARASGFFTLVRRDAAGRLTVVPYGIAYQGPLARAAELLRQAAAATAEPTLRAFLEARAEAFLTDDYYRSDVAWMELEGAVEPTIGPYETYGDGWFNAKAAYEAFICVQDEPETRALSGFSSALQDVEDHLPIDPAWRNPKLGALAPIRVVNELFAAGDAAHGVTTAAFNLPNDERVLAEKGAKRVMLRNLQQAKFERVALPIADRLLTPAARRQVAFAPFFTQILVHELVHGLGPHHVAGAARATTVREELGEDYAALEEAKADVGGLFALARFRDRGLVTRELAAGVYPSYLASMFRSLRFGLGEAHGRGTALQLNWFLDAGAVRALPGGRFDVDPVKFEAAVEGLTRELMTLMARGDRAGARALLRRLAVVRPPVAAALAKLRGVPVDVAPRFATAEALVREFPAEGATPPSPPAPSAGR